LARLFVIRDPLVFLKRFYVIMDQRVFIAQLNIEHFRRKLTTEQDTAKRLTLMRLLEEEQAKLVVALGKQSAKEEV
jgi:hypothetical protein